MRDFLVWTIFIAFFAVLYFGQTLQDRIRRKVGGSILSPLYLWRALHTREAYLFALLAILLVAVAGGLIALDELNYLPR
jgi:hypothetical protein